MEIQTIEIDGDFSVCSPCDQGAQHPESHAEGTRVLLADRVPADMPADVAATVLVHAVRNGLKVSGPITVHKSPTDDFDAATGKLVREWVATQP